MTKIVIFKLEEAIRIISQNIIIVKMTLFIDLLTYTI